MSETSLNCTRGTIFGDIYKNPEARFLYRSEKYGLMAIPDALPKFLGQIVLAPSEGTPGIRADYSKLPMETIARLAIMQAYFSNKMLRLLGENRPDYRIISHTEGYAVKDHAHTLAFPAIRGEAAGLYDTSIFCGNDTDETPNLYGLAAKLTYDDLALTTDETKELDELLEMKKKNRVKAFMNRLKMLTLKPLRNFQKNC